MFDLEQAIAEWRRQMLAAGIKSPVPLEELELHLREEIEQQMKAGLGEQEAFELAAQRTGRAAALKKEFKKIGRLDWEWLRKLKSILFGATEVPFPSLDDFAPSARQTLEIAPEEARRFHHDFIGTEHILLGIIKSQPQAIASLMQKLGVTSDAVRLEIEKFVGTSPAHAVAAKIPFTPRARQALQLAINEAKALNQPVVRAEHLFLGLLREGGGVAALVLKNLGVRIETTREEILREMRPDPGAG